MTEQYEENVFEPDLSSASDEEIRRELARRKDEPYVPPNSRSAVPNDGYGDQPSTDEVIDQIQEAAKPTESSAPKLSREEVAEKTQAIFAEHGYNQMSIEMVNALTAPQPSATPEFRDARPRHEVAADVNKFAEEANGDRNAFFRKLREAGALDDDHGRRVY